MIEAFIMSLGWTLAICFGVIAFSMKRRLHCGYYEKAEAKRQAKIDEALKLMDDIKYSEANYITATKPQQHTMDDVNTHVELCKQILERARYG